MTDNAIMLVRLAGAMLIALAFSPRAESVPFADSVEAYLPAPGQFVNNALYNDPTRALGPPAGGGTSEGGNMSVVSLGGFAGSITLKFNDLVEDDPLNPYGMDAIVFGNAFWVGGNQNRRWAEGGVIEISFDSNGNGIADDAWYLIPGSSLQPTGLTIEDQAWDDNSGTPTPPGNVAWYPMAPAFPDWPGMYVTSGFELPSEFETFVLENAHGMGAELESHIGYADVSPTLLLGDLDGDDVVDDSAIAPEDFYTVPDSPYTVGVTPDSGGGDAFDIATAIDPATGEPAGLTGFHFIRISTGVNHIAGVLGEISTEIDAVADVTPDPARFDIDGDTAVDIEDLYEWHMVAEEMSPDPITDVSGDLGVGEADRELLQRAVRRSEREDVTTP